MIKKPKCKTVMVFVFIILLAFSAWSGQVLATGEAKRFLLGYKAYLKKEFKNAFFHWKPLTEAGDMNAQYFIGIMYLNGQGTSKNWVEAARWFQASAEQGDVGAQYLFGEMNLKGMGLIKDFRKAGSWFTKAAEQGYPDAQFRLGEWYAEGKGGVTNLLLAYVWLKLAGANGIQAGDVKRKQLEAQLSAQEINHAKHLAYLWWVRFEQNSLYESR